MIAIFIIPFIILCGLIYLLIPIRLTRSPPPFSAIILRLIFVLLPWSMAEIFLIGTLVSLVKITSLADVSLGMSFYAFVFFSIFMVATSARLDKIQLHKLLKITPHHSLKKKPYSKQYTWALLITALILYIPASLLPIMTTRLLGHDDPSTILGGVERLWQHGSYPIAIVIFIASILIPIAKIIALAWLNYSVQTKSNVHHKHRMIIYRVAEFLGRWSMIDVFVVTILVSLIQLGNTMSVYPGPAAFAFSGVVIITMLAAMSFDSHLIWCPDKNQINNRRNNGNTSS
ncbi:MAG: paraquat-inducible protein A [Methylophagaceae bacterium]